MFVKLEQRVYQNGGYINTDIAFEINEIARVLECQDDYSCTNIVTKDGKIFTIPKKFSDVMDKISEVEKRGDAE